MRETLAMEATVLDPKTVKRIVATLKETADVLEAQAAGNERYEAKLEGGCEALRGFAEALEKTIKEG